MLDGLKEIPYEPNAILNEKYKFIYFYINKVANTSFKSWCHELNGYTNVKNVHAGHTFVNIDDIEKYEDYFKFAVVRNPFDRFVSWYIHKVTKRLNSKQAPQALKIYYGDMFKSTMTLKECAKIVAEIPDPYADAHFRSQHTFFPRKHVNFIAKLEHIDKHFKKIINKTGSPISLPYHKGNRTYHGDYRAHYDDETRDIIANRYKKDLKIFEYGF